MAACTRWCAVASDAAEMRVCSSWWAWLAIVASLIKPMHRSKRCQAFKRTGIAWALGPAAAVHMITPHSLGRGHKVIQAIARADKKQHARHNKLTGCTCSMPNRNAGATGQPPLPLWRSIGGGIGCACSLLFRYKHAFSAHTHAVSLVQGASESFTALATFMQPLRLAPAQGRLCLAKQLAHGSHIHISSQHSGLSVGGSQLLPQRRQNLLAAVPLVAAQQHCSWGVAAGSRISSMAAMAAGDAHFMAHNQPF